MTNIIYVSVSGNTKAVAEAICQGLEEATIYDISEVDPQHLPEGRLILGTGCYRGTAEPRMVRFIEQIHNRDIDFFVTMGSYADQEEGAQVENRIRDLIEAQNNRVQRTFRCMGRLAPEYLQRLKDGQAKAYHKMTPERTKRHEEAAKHPNETDFKNAVAAFKIEA